MRQIHAEGDGVIGTPRMHERLAFEGESASRNRVARLMAGAGFYGVPQRRRWQRKRISARPSVVRDQLARDFVALEPNTKWVTDISVPQEAALEMRVGPSPSACRRRWQTTASGSGQKTGRLHDEAACAGCCDRMRPGAHEIHTRLKFPFLQQ